MFVLYFDSEYFRWAPLLIESIRRQELGEKIYAFGINLSKEQENSFDSRIYLCDFTLAQKQPLLSYHIIERKAWYLNTSMGIFAEEQLFIMMDIDMLLLKPLTNLKATILTHKFDMAAVLANPDKICGGFYVFRRSDLVCRMLKEWDEFLMDGDFYFDKDQKSLASLVRKYMFEHGLKFLPLPRTYLDHLSRKESIVWSAHKSEFGNKDQRFKLYQKKLKGMR